MQSSNNTFKLLFDIGLNKYEAKIYLTLINEGISTAKNIADITGIPYGKVYEIINTLSNKGFAMTLPSKPMKYTATSPQQAALSAKREIRDKFRRIEKNAVNQLEPLFEQNRNFIQPKSNFLVINGRSNVVKKIEELIKKAKQNINIQCTANSLSRLVLHKAELKVSADKGVKVSMAGIIDRKNMKEIKSLDFCNLRSIKSSKNNFISIDGQECLVINPEPDDDNIVYGRDLGMHVLSKSFTKFLDNFFISDFRKARQVDLSTLAR